MTPDNPIKILVVEDEAMLLRALDDKLSLEGFTVIQATNGRDGLSTALKEHPTLILLDIMMPIMDGMTMLRELRKDDWGKTVPVIMLTNLVDSEKVDECIKQGVYDYLVKSEWTLEQLIKKVKEKIYT